MSTANYFFIFHFKNPTGYAGASVRFFNSFFASPTGSDYQESDEDDDVPDFVRTDLGDLLLPRGRGPVPPLHEAAPGPAAEMTGTYHFFVYIYF